MLYIKSEMKLRLRIYSCYLTAVTVLLHIDTPVQAYYRCEWVPRNDTKPSFIPRDTDTPTTTRQCYYKDSDIMSSFVSHCTTERHFIRTCSDTGSWDCDAFVGFCKTLIKVQAPPASDSKDGGATSGTVIAPKTDCAGQRTFFSLQEMGLAVLVSFISGSVVLTAIMVLVWKCRHTGTKLERQQSQTEREKEQRTAALQAITQIASVLKPPASDADTVFYLNPAYSRTVANDLIDIISENDHIYEEVMLRRMSRSVQLTPCSSRKRSQMAKSSSLNSISEMAENFERIERENLEILKNGMAPEVVAMVDMETGSGDVGDVSEFRERVDIEAPSTSDSGIMDEDHGNK